MIHLSKQQTETHIYSLLSSHSVCPSNKPHRCPTTSSSTWAVSEIREPCICIHARFQTRTHQWSPNPMLNNYQFIRATHMQQVKSVVSQQEAELCERNEFILNVFARRRAEPCPHLFWGLQSLNTKGTQYGLVSLYNGGSHNVLTPKIYICIPFLSHQALLIPQLN